MSQILIAGCGDVGTALGLELAAGGATVWGLRRHPDRLPAAIRPLAGDLSDADGLPPLPRDLDAVVFTAAAGERRDDRYRAIYVDGLRHLIAALRAAGAAPRRLLFTSSTAVYGQDDGSWVDETSATVPATFAGRRLLEAEALVRAAPWPGVVVRLAGIYGPGRERLIRKAEAGDPVPRTPPRYSNRIHRDDCAGLLAHLLALERPAERYLGVDDEPAPLFEVVSWICAQHGWPPPPAIDRGAGGEAGGQNKRCLNRRLHGSGYRLRYPSYCEGYGALLAAAPAAP